MTTRDQYIVTAALKEDGQEHSFVRLVTYNALEAENYDITAYQDTFWNIYMMHYLIDDNHEVVTQGPATLLYPQQGML